MAVVLVVGAAFAFNANFGSRICYTDSINGTCPNTLFCADEALDSKPATSTEQCYSIVADPSVQCTNVRCPNLGTPVGQP
jgi:hypothetical protein